MNIFHLHKIDRGWILSLIIILLSFTGCEKLKDSYIAISSQEQKLIHGTWILQDASKDGQSILVTSCASGSSKGYDIDFRTSGEVEVRCELLAGNSKADLGTWETSSGGELRLTLTDSSYYDYTNYFTVYVPVTPTQITWEIERITKRKLQIKEMRPDGTYEFIFINSN